MDFATRPACPTVIDVVGEPIGPGSGGPAVHEDKGTQVIPVEWDEDRTRYAPRLLLSADSFRPDRLFDCPASTDWRLGITSPSGNYLYSNRILPAGTPLGLNLSPSCLGSVRFDGDVVIPTLFDLTSGSPDPWMSTTPKEVITQRPGIRRAHGTVLIGGLGLGWFVRKVHDRPEVERIIVVEACRELLDWYGHDLCGRMSKVTDVIYGDVYDQIGKFGTKAKYLLDIWKDYGECVQDERFLQCRRLYKHVWGWGQEVAEASNTRTIRGLVRPRGMGCRSAG